MRSVIFFYCLVAVVTLIGCEKADPIGPDPGAGATLSEIQSTIFNLNCAVSNCHAGPNPQMGMNLSAGQAYANIVSVASTERPDLFRIKPNDPENSYLYRKILGMNIEFARMPFGRDPLSEEQIALVREWIENGAQNN